MAPGASGTSKSEDSQPAPPPLFLSLHTHKLHRQVAAATLEASCIKKGKESTDQSRMMKFIQHKIKNKDIFMGTGFTYIQFSA